MALDGGAPDKIGSSTNLQTVRFVAAESDCYLLLEEFPKIHLYVLADSVLHPWHSSITLLGSTGSNWNLVISETFIVTHGANALRWRPSRSRGRTTVPGARCWSAVSTGGTNL